MKRIQSKLTRVVTVLLLCTAAATTAISQENPTKAIDMNALAARGEALANEDPLATELRNLHPEGPARRGFDLGMGVAEGHTLPGPGKQRLQASLSPGEEQGGFATAVSFSLERNNNKTFAAIGAAIAQADPSVAEARNAAPEAFRDRAGAGTVFYKLGFDVATGIFGDPALGAQGNSSTGRGSLKILDSLSAAGQRGFKASATFNLSRRGFPPPVFPESSSPAPEGRPRAPGEMTRSDNFGKRSSALDRMIEGGWKAPETLSGEIRCRGGRDKFIFTVENARVSSTGETINIYLLTFEPSPQAAGPRGEGLKPGQCSWADRPMNERFLIKFETPANGQLSQTRHGSVVDSSPMAAERFPDGQTIPAYLNDPAHYWSFFGAQPVNNFFLATGHKYWKPSLRNESDDFKRRKVRNHALIPGKPE